MKTLPDDVFTSDLDAVPANSLKVIYALVVRAFLQKVQQELAKEEVEYWVRSELEKMVLSEKMDTLEETVEIDVASHPVVKNLR